MDQAENFRSLRARRLDDRGQRLDARVEARCRLGACGAPRGDAEHRAHELRPGGGHAPRLVGVPRPAERREPLPDRRLDERDLPLEAEPRRLDLRAQVTLVHANERLVRDAGGAELGDLADEPVEPPARVVGAEAGDHGPCRGGDDLGQRVQGVLVRVAVGEKRERGREAGDPVRRGRVAGEQVGAALAGAAGAQAAADAHDDERPRGRPVAQLGDESVRAHRPAQTSSKAETTASENSGSLIAASTSRSGMSGRRPERIASNSASSASRSS